MSTAQLLLLPLYVVYALIAFGAMLGTTPREFFHHPVERFLVRVCCGLVWPFFFGYWIVRVAVRESGQR